MKSFLKYCLATIVGIIISSFLLFLIFIIVVSSIVSSSNKPYKPEPNSVLLIKLNYPVYDRTINDPFENFDMESFTVTKNLGLYDLLLNIEKAKNDDNIKGIFFNPGAFMAGQATATEIRNALSDFKKSGKFMIAYAEYYTQKDYYIASVADKVYLNPSGIIEFNGLSRQVLFYKGTFEKLKIEPEIFRHGEYKSYVEPYINDRMSAENKEQTLEYLFDLWKFMLTGISETRGITLERLNQIADSMNVFFSFEKAKEAKLIDGAKYYDEVMDEIKELCGTETGKETPLVNIAKYNDYRAPRKEKSLSRNKIAIVFAQGDINNGKGSDTEIGSERFAKAIKEAREDSSVKALVLRVNSPGGTVLGSDNIRREIELTRQKKPVVASMGDVAASGGYYILCQSDTIVANSNTITGSIGVLAILFNLKGFFNDKLGITSDVVNTNKNSDFINFLRPMNEWEKRLMLENVDNEYKRFVNYVATGRNKNFNEIDKIGRGRVWSGEDAIKNGLVDINGGLLKSIEIAAEMASVENYRIIQLPKMDDPYTKFFGSAIEEIKTNFFRSEFGEYFPYLKELKTVMKYQGIQARLAFITE